MQPSSQENWIEAFTAAHGRPPRILHMGNICNNAYQIAKMQNSRGADCDVLSADYYHIMGAPEWEDADFTGDYGDQNFPSWHKVNLHGFQRPRWFAQGPKKLATAYLLARRTGTPAKANRLWKKMERRYRRLASRQGSPFKPLLELADKLTDMVAMAAKYLFKSPALFALKLRSLSGSISNDQLARLQQLEGTAPLIAKATADFKEAFPQRPLLFGRRLAEAAADALGFKELFACYDLVHAYSTDPIWPYLAGANHYIAYENGTLRYLPVDNNEFSDLVMLAYAKAGAAMLTNTDCYDSAVYITQHTSTPLVYALHGLDVARMLEKMDRAKENQGFDARFGVDKAIPLFFCPSRHTWDDGLGVYLKGEDKALRAAESLAAKGLDFQLVMVDWGSDTDKIKALIEHLPHLAQKVRWINPIDKLELHKAFFNVDAVLDQFYWPVFGAIAFEVLCASSAALISASVSNERMTEFFGSPLPYLTCGSEEDIATAMELVIRQPEKAKALAAKGRHWMSHHHSADCIVQKCMAAYGLCLPQAAPL